MTSLKQLLRHIIAIVLLLQGFVATAEQFSYVYIQGDKQTPFYVKFEDEMLPRYGKNYTIISQLTPGPIHIQILFQQNVFPAQSFTIIVPENGSRGFLLTKQGDAFSLYDIQQQFYLPAGNTTDQDHIPANQLASSPVAISTLAVTQGYVNPDTNLLGQPLSAPPTEPIIQPAAEPEVVAETPPVKKESGGPEFMNMELNHEATVQTNNAPKLSDEDFKGKVAIVNSDCPHALDNDLFEAIYKKAKDKSGTPRLKYLLDKTNNNCFTTNQIRTLTRTLENDPERYTFLKKAYSRVTDQSAFPVLENLLSSREWKDYFKLIVP